MFFWPWLAQMSAYSPIVEEGGIGEIAATSLNA